MIVIVDRPVKEELPLALTARDSLWAVTRAGPRERAVPAQARGAIERQGGRRGHLAWAEPVLRRGGGRGARPPVKLALGE